MKALKHASSILHKMAVEKSKFTETVEKQILAAANRKSDAEKITLKNMFRIAYFMFYFELPHTTLWRTLISTISAVDGTGVIKDYIQRRQMRTICQNTALPRFFTVSVKQFLEIR